MDTWGISGGDFIALYVAVAAVAFAGAHHLRRRVVRDPEDLWSPPQLDDYEVAMLNEGPRLVIAAAAANLREAGTLALRDHDRALIVAQPLAPGAHALERRVHGAVHGVPSEDRRRLAALERDATVQRIRQRLLDLRLLASDRQRIVARLQALWLVPVVVLGAARIAAGSADGKPVGFIWILTIAAACAAGGLALRPPRQTERGRQALSGLRVAQRSARESLGATVALAGLAELWGADAALATAIGMPREAAGGGGGWGGGCGDGGCGGGCGG